VESSTSNIEEAAGDKVIFPVGTKLLTQMHMTMDCSYAVTVDAPDVANEAIEADEAIGVDLPDVVDEAIEADEAIGADVPVGAHYGAVEANEPTVYGMCSFSLYPSNYVPSGHVNLANCYRETYSEMRPVGAGANTLVASKKPSPG
jgi:hypothetical protein